MSAIFPALLADGGEAECFLLLVQVSLWKQLLPEGQEHEGLAPWRRQRVPLLRRAGHGVHVGGQRVVGGKAGVLWGPGLSAPMPLGTG